MAESEESDGIVAPKGPATIQDRIAAFKMLDGMVDATQAQRILRLTLVGFNRNDIAAMLQTSAQSVSQVLYMERKKAQKTPRAARTRKSSAEDEKGE